VPSILDLCELTQVVNYIFCINSGRPFTSFRVTFLCHFEQSEKLFPHSTLKNHNTIFIKQDCIVAQAFSFVIPA